MEDQIIDKMLSVELPSVSLEAWKLVDREDIKALIQAYQIAVASEAVAWVHTMHMERGNKKKTVNFREKDPFGRSGHDYDPTYTVTSEPLFRAASREAER